MVVFGLGAVLAAGGGWLGHSADQELAATAYLVPRAERLAEQVRQAEAEHAKQLHAATEWHETLTSLSLGSLPAGPRDTYFSAHAWVESQRARAAQAGVATPASFAFGLERILLAQGSWGEKESERRRFHVARGLLEVFWSSLLVADVESIETGRLEGLEQGDSMTLTVRWMGQTDSARRIVEALGTQPWQMADFSVEPLPSRPPQADDFVSLADGSASRFTITALVPLARLETLR